MFGPLGIWEIMLIILAVVVLFGAKKLPELGAGIGKGITNFRKALKGTEEGVPAIDEKSEKETKKTEEDEGLKS